MNELPGTGIDADVVLLPAGLEEHQIPVLQPVSVHRPAEIGLGFSGAGQGEAQHLLVGKLGEGGAVEAGAIGAAHAIGDAAPLLIEAVEGTGLAGRRGRLRGTGAGDDKQGQQGRKQGAKHLNSLIGHGIHHRRCSCLEPEQR